MKSKNLILGVIIAIIVVTGIILFQKNANDIQGNLMMGEQGRGVNVDSSPEVDNEQQRYQIWTEDSAQGQ